MQPLDKIFDYEQKVCEQVRWKKVHPMISKELEAHILDQRDAYIAEGDDEETATDKAIAQMGDPVLTGSMLDRSHRPRPQWGMLGLAVLLLGLGVLLRILLGDGEENAWFAMRQAGVALTGIGIMLVAYFMDISLIGRKPILFSGCIMAAAAALILMADPVNGKLYFYSGPIVMNCAYLSLVYPLVLAVILYAVRGKRFGAVLAFGVSVCLMAGMALQTSLMFGCLIVVLSGILLFGICAHREWLGFQRKTGYVLLGLGILLVFAMALVFIFNNVYLYERLSSALQPELEPWGSGYLAVRLRGLLGEAKLIGTSAAANTMGDVFPAADLYTDYLLTNVIMHGGWIALAAVISLFALFIGIGFKRCVGMNSVLGRLVSSSVLMTLTMEVIGYIAFNLGFTLLSPIGMPLLSYGNTATVINLALIGLMLSVFRTGNAKSEGTWKRPTGSPFISWCEGKLIIDCSGIKLVKHAPDHIAAKD